MTLLSEAPNSHPRSAFGRLADALARALRARYQPEPVDPISAVRVRAVWPLERSEPPPAGTT